MATLGALLEDAAAPLLQREWVRIASAHLPTRHGMFRILGYTPVEVDPDSCERQGRSMIALAMGDVSAVAPPVYIHSACEVCEIFQASHCEARSQVDAVLQIIERYGRGLLFYSHDDYAFGTDALRHLQSGFARAAWEQCAMDAAQILRSMGIRTVSLIGDDPVRATYLQQFGLEVVGSNPIPPKGGERCGTANDV